MSCGWKGSRFNGPEAAVPHDVGVKNSATADCASKLLVVERNRRLKPIFIYH